MHWWIPELSIGEKLLRSLIAYCFLLLMFRLMGRREVSQMTVFELIVLLTLSNVLRNAMIGPDNSVSGGLSGAATILPINRLVGRAASSTRSFERSVEGVPLLLVHSGYLVESNPRRANISPEELFSNFRSQAVFEFTAVRAAVLEPSGKLSALKPDAGSPVGNSD